MTPPELAALIVSTCPANRRRASRVRQLLPTESTGMHGRVSAFQLSQRLRLKGHAASEKECAEALAALEDAGCLRRASGGYAVTNWSALRQYGGAQ